MASMEGVNARQRIGQAEPVNVVTLIHGTFAKDAQWTHENSTLSQRLRQDLPAPTVVTRFEWSGKNSHSARLEAGQNLSKFLRKLASTYPRSRHHLIAHSHGGNVALYALRDTDARHQVRSLTCLATPFIVATPRELDATLTPLRYAVPIGVCVPWITVGWYFVLYTLALGAIEPKFGFGPGIMLFIAAAISTFALLKLDKWWKRYLGQVLPAKLGERRRSILDHVALPRISDLPIHIIRVRRDEASGYLQLVDWLADIPSRLWQPKKLAWLIVGVTVMILAGLVYVGFGASVEPWEEVVSGLAFAFFSFPFSATVVFLLLLLVFQAWMILWSKTFRGHALGFGERLLQNWLVHISAAPRPRESGVLREQEYTLHGPGLRHSMLYQSPEVIDSMVKWLSDEHSIELSSSLSRGVISRVVRS